MSVSPLATATVTDAVGKSPILRCMSRLFLQPLVTLAGENVSPFVSSSVTLAVTILRHAPIARVRRVRNRHGLVLTIQIIYRRYPHDLICVPTARTEGQLGWAYRGCFRISARYCHSHGRGWLAANFTVYVLVVFDPSVNPLNADTVRARSSSVTLAV